MSTKACQNLAESSKSCKKSAKGNHAARRKKHSRWKHKRKSRTRGSQSNNRGPRQIRPNLSCPTYLSRSFKMGSVNRNPAASFWDNYKNAMEWQNKHFINYWKSRCAALELENQHLYKTLETLSCSTSIEKKTAEENNDDSPITDNVPDGFENEDVEEEDEEEEEQDEEVQEEGIIEAEEDEDCGESEEFTYVIDEDMLEFLETSVKHKIELKKKKDAEMELEAAEELAKATEKMKLPRVIMQERRDEMAKLYGADSAPMILGMETAMQLTFDRFVDKYQPKHWPNIPLSL